MWLARTSPTAPSPLRRARSQAVSTATVAAGWPKPHSPLTRAAPGRSSTIRGRAAGRIQPSRTSSTYHEMRITPCESWPARLDATRWSATCSAMSAGAPAASKMRRPRSRRYAGSNSSIVLTLNGRSVDRRTFEKPVQGLSSPDAWPSFCPGRPSAQYCCHNAQHQRAGGHGRGTPTLGQPPRRRHLLRGQPVDLRAVEEKEDRTCSPHPLTAGVLGSVQPRFTHALGTQSSQPPAGLLLHLFDRAEGDRLRGTRLGAGRHKVELQPVVAERAFEGTPVAFAAVDHAEGAGRDAVATAVAHVRLDDDGAELGAEDGARRADLEAGGFRTVLADVRVHQPPDATVFRGPREPCFTGVPTKPASWRGVGCFALLFDER